MAALEELLVERPLDLYPLEGEVQEGLRVLLAHEARGDVGQPSCVAVQIEGILADVEAEALRGERSGGELPDEGVLEYPAVDRFGGLPGFVAPAFHGLVRGVHRL